MVFYYEMNQMVLVLIHLFLTVEIFVRNMREVLTYFWLFMEDLSFPFFFYSHEAKERMKKNCNQLGTPTSLKRETSEAEWFPPLVPLILGIKIM